jgi:hypothetical protein
VLRMARVRNELTIRKEVVSVKEVYHSIISRLML